MPNGRKHAGATLLLAAGTGAAAFTLLDAPLETGLALAGGCLVGLVLTPDLDVDRGSISHRIVKRSAGAVIGFAWRLFWFPYALLMPHRSWWSHMPLFSTLVRAAYLLALPALVWWLAGTAVELPALALPAWRWLPAAFTGLVMSDTLHAVMDIADSFVKRRVYRWTGIRW